MASGGGICASQGTVWRGNWPTAGVAVPWGPTLGAGCGALSHLDQDTGLCSHWALLASSGVPALAQASRVFPDSSRAHRRHPTKGHLLLSRGLSSLCLWSALSGCLLQTFPTALSSCLPGLGFYIRLKVPLQVDGTQVLLCSHPAVMGQPLSFQAESWIPGLDPQQAPIS